MKACQRLQRKVEHDWVRKHTMPVRARITSLSESISFSSGAQSNPPEIVRGPQIASMLCIYSKTEWVMRSRKIPGKWRSRCCQWLRGVPKSKLDGRMAYWHIMVDSMVKYVRCTVFIEMLIHAVLAKRAITVFRRGLGKVSVTSHKRE